MLRVLNAKFLAVFLLLSVGLACSGVNSQESSETPQKELVNLPSDVRNAFEIVDVMQDEIFLLLTSDNELYQEKMQYEEGTLVDPNKSYSTTTKITIEQLREILKSAPEPERPWEKLVNLKIDSAARFENVVSVFRLIRDGGFTTVRLLTAKKPEWDAKYKGYFEVELQTPLLNEIFAEIPNPLTLLAVLDQSGSLSLNGEFGGDVSNSSNLTERLSTLFNEREKNEVLRAGMNEIDKRVILSANGSNRYGDFVKLLDAVKGSGASTIYIFGLDETRLTPKIGANDGESQADDDLQDNANSLEE